MPAHRNNLVALGSAAVIAVYSAGYLRTRSAAAALANETGELRPKLPPLDQAPVTSKPEPVVVASAPVSVEPKLERQQKQARHHGEHIADSSAHKETMIAVAIVDTTSADSVKTAPATPAVVAPATTTPDSAKAAKQDSVKAPKWKDGVFHGYGMSRHGDIEAEVEIKNGKIVSAKISQCLTRYSCSWIDPLLPQVAERQTYDVDFVSGATESSNAFRYAVWEALSRAK